MNTLNRTLKSGELMLRKSGDLELRKIDDFKFAIYMKGRAKIWCEILLIINK